MVQKEKKKNRGRIGVGTGEVRVRRALERESKPDAAIKARNTSCDFELANSGTGKKLPREPAPQSDAMDEAKETTVWVQSVDEALREREAADAAVEAGRVAKECSRGAGAQSGGLRGGMLSQGDGGAKGGRSQGRTCRLSRGIFKLLRRGEDGGGACGGVNASLARDECAPSFLSCSPPVQLSFIHQCESLLCLRPTCWNEAAHVRSRTRRLPALTSYLVSYSPEKTATLVTSGREQSPRTKKQTRPGPTREEAQNLTTPFGGSVPQHTLHGVSTATGRPRRRAPRDTAHPAQGRRRCRCRKEDTTWLVGRKRSWH